MLDKCEVDIAGVKKRVEISLQYRITSEQKGRVGKSGTKMEAEYAADPRYDQCPTYILNLRRVFPPRPREPYQAAANDKRS